MIGLKERQHFSNEFKLGIIRQVLSGNLGTNEARRKYNLKGHSCILNWMRRFGIHQASDCDNYFVTLGMSQESLSPEQLSKRIKELEKALEDANLKADAYSTMIDIAEKELKIKIRKKSSTKPSEK